MQGRLMAERDFPLPLPGLVHVAQTLLAHRAVDPAEPLSLRVRAERLRPHARGAQVDLVATASVGNEPVWSGTSTYLARGVTVQGGDSSGGADDGPVPRLAGAADACGARGPGRVPPSGAAAVDGRAADPRRARRMAIRRGL